MNSKWEQLFESWLKTNDEKIGDALDDLWYRMTDEEKKEARVAAKRIKDRQQNPGR